MGAFKIYLFLALQICVSNAYELWNQPVSSRFETFRNSVESPLEKFLGKYSLDDLLNEKIIFTFVIYIRRSRIKAGKKSQNLFKS